MTLKSVSSSNVVLQLALAASGPTVLRYMVISTPTSPAGPALTQYSSPTTPQLLYVNGLTAGTQYTIQASACGVAGCNPAASLTGIRTAPNAPTYFRATSVTGTTVTLGWNASLPTAAYTYRLRYRTVSLNIVATFMTADGSIIPAGSPSSASLVYGAWSAYQSSDLGGSAATATISGLTKNQAYQMSCVSQLNSVDSTSVAYFVRPVDPPGSVDALFLQVSSAVHIN